MARGGGRHARRRSSIDDGSRLCDRCRMASKAQATSQDSLDLLVSILDLEELELNLFRGRTPKEDRLRVFGG